MLVLTLITSAIAVISSTVTAAPTGLDGADNASDNPDRSLLHAERTDNTINCDQEFKDCISAVKPLTLGLYHTCADAKEVCIDTNLKQRHVASTEDSTPEYLPNLLKRTECTDGCWSNYQTCLGSLGPKPPENWWLYCSEGLAKCNGNCPKKRSASENNEETSNDTIISMKRSAPIVLSKRTECTDQCWNDYQSCLVSLGSKPPQSWWLYCNEGLAKCNYNCPKNKKKRSILTDIEVQDAEPVDSVQTVTRSGSGECYGIYDVGFKECKERKDADKRQCLRPYHEAWIDCIKAQPENKNVLPVEGTTEE